MRIMANNLHIQGSISIPEHELVIETSRAGGPGGQHVNKTESRVTLRWNITHTTALTDEQKARVSQYFHNTVTEEGDILIITATERSQHQNKELAYKKLAELLRKALYIPKKRIATTVSQSTKEKNIQQKKKRALIKKFRSKISHDE